MLAAETLRQNLAALAGEYARHTGTSAGMIGRLSIKDSKFLPRVAAGDGFNVKTYDRVVLWLSDNWPDSADWPASIDRPEPSESEAASRDAEGAEPAEGEELTCKEDGSPSKDAA